MTTWDDLLPGRRVVLARSVERFPHFNVEPGAIGTIEEAINGEHFRVRMHEPIEGCEEWENCIEWYADENIEDVLLDVTLAPQVGDLIPDPNCVVCHGKRETPDGQRCSCVLVEVMDEDDEDDEDGEVDVSEGTDSELEALLAARDTDDATAAACTKELKARRDAEYSERDVAWWLDLLGAYEAEPGIAYRCDLNDGTEGYVYISRISADNSLADLPESLDDRALATIWAADGESRVDIRGDFDHVARTVALILGWSLGGGW